MINIDKIQQLSRVMQVLCVLAMLTIPAVLAWVWLDFSRFAPAIAEHQGLVLQPAYIGWSNLLLAFICSMIPAGVVIYGLHRLNRLFQLYQQSIFFSATCIKHLKVFAITLFFSALLKPITGSLLSVILTMDNPPGERSLSISLGSSEISIAFIAAVFWIISAIMLEAKYLADESSEII